MFCVVETVEESEINCMAVPKCWVKNKELYYPLHSREVSNARRKCLQPKSDWHIMPCKILRDNIDSLHNALAEEQQSAFLSSSESGSRNHKPDKHKLPDVNALFVTNDNVQPKKINHDDLQNSLEKEEGPAVISSNSTLINGDSVQQTLLSEMNFAVNGNREGLLQYTEDINRDHNFINPTGYAIREQHTILDLDASFNSRSTNAHTAITNQDQLQKISHDINGLQLKVNQIMKCLADLKATMNVILEKIPPLATKIAPHDQPPGTELPIGSINELQDMEWKLKTNLDLKNQMISYMATFGGPNANGCARNIMKRFVSDTVLVLYSWGGTNIKKPFLAFFEIQNLITMAVKKKI